jgi:DNA-directed RNA polymerase beta subunit
LLVYWILARGIETADDIDDKRKIKPCGDLIQNQLAIGLSRLNQLLNNTSKSI